MAIAPKHRRESVRGIFEVPHARDQAGTDRLIVVEPARLDRGHEQLRKSTANDRILFTWAGTIARHFQGRSKPTATDIERSLRSGQGFMLVYNEQNPEALLAFSRLRLRGNSATFNQVGIPWSGHEWCEETGRLERADLPPVFYAAAGSVMLCSLRDAKLRATDPVYLQGYPGDSRSAQNFFTTKAGFGGEEKAIAAWGTQAVQLSSTSSTVMRSLTANLPALQHDLRPAAQQPRT